MKKQKTTNMFEKATSLIKGLAGDDIPDYIKNSQKQSDNNTKIINNIMTETTVIPVNNTKETDEKYEEQILKAVRGANLSGPDFLEFSEAVKKLQQINPNMSLDDCIKNSFIVLSSGGLTKEVILETGDHYLQVLKTEEEKFSTAILQAHKSKVSYPIEEIKELQTESSSLEQQLNEIQSKISSIKNKIQQKEKEAEDAKIKLSFNKAKFNNTLYKVKTNIIELLNHVRSIEM